MRGLCINCLSYTEIKPVDVGPEKGDQRDPFREKLQLCETCGDALVEGDLSTFHGWFNEERTIDRSEVDGSG